MTWAAARLGDLVDAKSGFACGEDVLDGVFQFRMNNVTTEGALVLSKRRRVPLNSPKLSSFLLQPADVLFNSTNSPELVGKTAIVSGLDEPATFSNHFFRLRPTGRIDARYLARWLTWQYQRKTFMGLCRQWVNQASVSREALLGLTIPLPPLPEQRRVADILDQADALRAKRRNAVTCLDAIPQSIFLDMFGDPESNPNGWEVAPLAGVVRDGTIVTYGIVQAGDECEDGVPYVRTGDIVNGEIVTTQLRRTAPDIAARFTRSRVDVGDIVMSIRATVGTTALVPSSVAGANLTQGTARIAPGERVIGPYLLHMLRTPGIQNWIQRQVKGATFREITLSRLRELPVIMPPVEQQEAFGVRMDAVDDVKRLQRESLVQSGELFASLQHRAFRGEL
jgi:type I restriction enzyme S subunit